MLVSCTAAFLSELATLIPGVLRDAEPRDLEEPRGRWTGQAAAVACPRTTDEVSQIVRACAKAGVAIVPLGGGTGLVGGQILAEGPVPLLISLERMTALRGAYPSENVLVVEAGMILQQVQDEAQKLNRLFPLSLASQGSAPRPEGALRRHLGFSQAIRR